MRSIAEFLSVPEDALEGKLQVLAGWGLVQVAAAGLAQRQVEFLESPSAELGKMIREFYEGRQGDFHWIEMRVRSLFYKTILTMEI